MQHSIVIHMKNFAQASPESIGSSIKASVEMGTHWLSWVIRLLLPSPQLRRVLPLLVPYTILTTQRKVAVSIIIVTSGTIFGPDACWCLCGIDSTQVVHAYLAVMTLVTVLYLEY